MWKKKKKKENPREKLRTNSLPSPRVSWQHESWLEHQIWKKSEDRLVQAPSPDRWGSYSLGRGRDFLKARAVEAWLRTQGSQASRTGPRCGKPVLLVWFLFLQIRLTSRAGIRGQINSRNKFRNPTQTHLHLLWYQCPHTINHPAVEVIQSWAPAGERKPQNFSQLESPYTLPLLPWNWSWGQISHSSPPRHGNPRADEERGRDPPPRVRSDS